MNWAEFVNSKKVEYEDENTTTWFPAFLQRK
jgi:hypothetical protein